MPALDRVTLGVQHTCLTGGGAELRVTVRLLSDEPGTRSVGCEVVGPNGVTYDGFIEEASHTFRFSSVVDGTYQVRAYGDVGPDATRTYAITCGGNPPASGCDLAVTNVVATNATTPGGVGSVTLTLASSAPPITASATRLSDNVTDRFARNWHPGPFELYSIPAGFDYRLDFTDARGCTVQVPFTIEDVAPPPPPPVVIPPPAFFAVAGRQPRPALLATPVSSLFTLDNQPRPGLHVQVELLRVDAEVPFARLRKTVRTQAEQVDVSASLHALLRPEISYPAGLPAVRDGNATLAFTYRWREVDADTEGEWQSALGSYYALLSAVPRTVPESRYLASVEQPAAPLSAFPSGQLVQQVGYPLDVAVWLPERPAEATWYAEWRYLDALGAELEIRAVPLPDYLSAGVTRLSLPARPLPCAQQVVLQLTDTDRSYAGTCPVYTPPPAEAHDFTIPDFNDNDLK